MADANIRINVETATLEQLNDELARLQAEVKKVAVGSAEFKRLSAEVRRVDGAVEGANKKLKSFDVGQLVGNVAKVGSAVASASALFKEFGAEGSDSNKQIQSALEATNTILGAAAIAEGIAAAGQVAYTVATEGATVAQGFFATAVGTSTGALAAFKVALVTTGIGALVVGLGFLIAAFMDSKEAAAANTAAIEDFNKSVDAYLAYQDKLAGYRKNFLNEELKRAELQKKSDKEVFEIKNRFLIKERDATIATQRELGKLQEEAIDLEFKTQAEKDKALTIEQKKKSQGIKSLTEQERGYYERLLKIRENFNAKNDKLAVQRGNFDSEIIQLTLDFQLQAQKKAEEAADKAAQKAKERRDKLRADLEAIVNIIKEADQEIQLAVLNAEQKTILQGLENITKRTKTFAQVIAELRKEGQGPYADFINNLFKSGKTIEEISKIIEDSFGQKKTDVIGNFFQKGTEELTNSFNDLVNNIGKYEEQVKKFGVGFGESFTEGFTSVIKDAEGNFVSGVSSISLSKIPSIEDLVTLLDEYGDELDSLNASQIKSLRDLKATGAITDAEFEKALANQTKAFSNARKQYNKFRSDSVNSFIDLSNQIIQTGLGKIQQAAQDQITELELKFIKDSANKSAKEKIKLEEKLQKDIKSIKTKELEKELELLASQEKDINDLKDKGVISVEEAENKIQEIKRKSKEIQLKIEKGITDDTKNELQERIDSVDKFFRKLKEYYATLETSLQSFANILADQAAKTDIRLSEEIERVTQSYEERYKLIDEEEKKLDDLEKAKETNLTKTERKRIALAKERAAFEAQQEEELAKLEAERANAAADAAIQQANLNFALAVGQIVVSTAEAIAKTIAQLGGVGAITPPGAALIALTGAAGAAQLAAANSARSTAIAQAEASRPSSTPPKAARLNKAAGGLIEGPGNGVSDSVPANLSNGEFVVNANATQKFLPLLNQINQSGLQGGNPVNPSGGSDSQMVSLLQEIKSQLSQPNRSYVLLNDIENIQNKQQYINRRSNVL